MRPRRSGEALSGVYAPLRLLAGMVVVGRWKSRKCHPVNEQFTAWRLGIQDGVILHTAQKTPSNWRKGIPRKRQNTLHCVCLVTEYNGNGDADASIRARWTQESRQSD